MPNYIPPTFDEIIEMATEHLLESGSHLPTVFAVGTKNVAVIMGELPSDPDARDQLMYVLGHEASRQAIGQLHDVFFVMEAWMGRNADVMPSNDPKRVECLILSHYNLRSAQLSLVIFEMIRDSEEKLIDLVKFADTRGEAGSDAESALVESFVRGFLEGRKGRLPRTTGGRG
jgi:hypothetical protein